MGVQWLWYMIAVPHRREGQLFLVTLQATTEAGQSQSKTAAELPGPQMQVSSPTTLKAKGGAIYVDSGSDVTINEETLFSHNTVRFNGGAVFIG